MYIYTYVNIIFYNILSYKTVKFLLVNNHSRNGRRFLYSVQIELGDKKKRLYLQQLIAAIENDTRISGENDVMS